MSAHQGKLSPTIATSANRRGVRTMLQCIGGGIVLYALQMHAQAFVTDDGFSFSPDPVNIVAGEYVYWVDDGSGPYLISSDTGAWAPFQTPNGVVFTQPGQYGYHDDAGDFGTVFVTPNIPPSV